MNNQKHNKNIPTDDQKIANDSMTSTAAQNTHADQESTTCGLSMWGFFKGVCSYLDRMRDDFNDIMAQPSDIDGSNDIGIGY